MHSLIAAYSVAWAIVLVYIVTLQTRQRRIQGELAVLREALSPAPRTNGEPPGVGEEFVVAAAEIARAAGSVLRQKLGRVAVEYKGEADLVTAADRASEELILERLRARFPSHGIVAEEGGRTSARSGYTWYVDPLDGTTNYAHRLPFFAVSLGLELDGEPLAGVVYNPILDEMFSALRGAGAQLNDRPIHVAPTASLDDALLATGFPSRKRHANPNIHLYHHLTLHSQGVRRCGSAALDLCYTADGRFDGFWEFNLKPWDTAAGALIVREAGGVVTDILGGPFELRSAEVLAGTPAIHAALVAAFAEIFAGRTPELPAPGAYLKERSASTA